MKKQFILLGLLCFLALNTIAQDQADSLTDQPGNFHRQYQRRPKETMAARLHFSAEQKRQLAAIHSQYSHQILELNRQQTLTINAMHTKRQALLQAQRTAFLNLLSVDQKNRLDSFRQALAQRRQQKEAMHLDKMQRSLDLTAQQLVRIQALDIKFMQDRTQASIGALGDRTLARATISELMQQHRADISDLLTPEQRNRMQAWKAQRTGRL